VRHFSFGQKVLIWCEFAKYICVIKRLQKYCINIHCQLNRCAFPCVILSCLSICLSVCLSVCLRITECIFLQFDTGNSHKKISSHFSVALDNIIVPYNLHKEWLIFPMHIVSVTLFVFPRVKKHLNKIEGMHQHCYTMHLFPNI
jgi:hypothetical protein